MNARVVVTRDIPREHPSFAGHFPGQPLLPGVVLLSEVMEAALADASLAPRLAAGASLQAAKFLSPVRPGARLELVLEGDDAGLRFEVTQAGAPTARGAFAWGAAS
jgi:3-hydroxymyristoyl/3-hydroxydecanoyl-(acyl carrier protein) dehydratase